VRLQDSGRVSDHPTDIIARHEGADSHKDRQRQAGRQEHLLFVGSGKVVVVSGDTEPDGSGKTKLYLSQKTQTIITEMNFHMKNVSMEPGIVTNEG